jgi:phosphoglycolate phosphatase
VKNKEAKRKIIFFDFDGVIADSFSVLFEINKQINPKIKTKDDYSNLFDGNINDWKKTSSKSQEEIKKADDDFFARYAAQMANVKVIPGMEDAVRELAKPYALIIISSTITSLIDGFLRSNRMLSYFEEFDGDEIVHNNKTERIAAALEKYGAQPGDCIFITDTLGDMREAARCGIASIGVEWGVQKKENLRKANPFRIVEKPEELFQAVSDYFNTLK